MPVAARQGRLRNKETYSMRMHKFLSAVAAVMLFGMLLAACGGATPAAAPTAAPAAAAPTAAPAAAEPTAMAAPTAMAEPTAAAAPTAMAEPTAAAATGGTPDKATLQLKWVTQAQFAGYYAALDQGY